MTPPPSGYSTGRFTALGPLGKKSGDTDWYGYCVDDPVNRVESWGASQGMDLTRLWKR